MSEPFLGEIRIVGFNFAPQGWAFCNGQLLAIAQNTALFSLLGTTYGGNGTSNFALPNLQGRMPIHAGTGLDSIPYIEGQIGGAASQVLSVANLPAHTHAVNCDAQNGGNNANPAGNLPAIESTGTSRNYSSQAGNGTMNAAMIGSTGSGTAISTLPPYLCLNFIIALEGIFPAS